MYADVKLFGRTGGTAMKYRWGNNSKRAMMKDRECKVITRGKMNSICIEFENGQREIVSRRSVF